MEPTDAVLIGLAMDCLTIRPATQADVPALSALIQRTVRQSNASDYAAEVVEL
ncbi:MAG: hypothetical protein QOG78_4797, partial [Rhodospirillaceae bacterium]|nr:hypothetical protein [Rhodospirillaceae bacterium]